MTQVVQIGAGKIGRGFLGQLFQEGGGETIFLDIDTPLVDSLNERGSYPLRLVSDGLFQTRTIDNFRAVDARDTPAWIDSLLHADLISAAVGVSNLPAAAITLAQGLNTRAAAGCGPIDILLCENQWHAAPLVRALLEPHIATSAQTYFRQQVGLVETVIGRTVPAPSEAVRAEDPLLLIADDYKELPVARDMMRGSIPTLPGLLLADNIEAYEARKLYLHNMAHAALAYLGYRKGFEFLWQCAEDSEIAAICRMAMQEVTAALGDRYGLRQDDLTLYQSGLWRRFADRALGDTVVRVAADPLRKLRPSDRLIGAATLCIETGRDVSALAGIIAAAIRFDAPADPAAIALQSRRQSEGDRAVLDAVCAIPPASALGSAILHTLERSSEDVSE